MKVGHHWVVRGYADAVSCSGCGEHWRQRLCYSGTRARSGALDRWCGELWCAVAGSEDTMAALELAGGRARDSSGVQGWWRCRRLGNERCTA